MKLFTGFDFRVPLLPVPPNSEQTLNTTSTTRLRFPDPLKRKPPHRWSDDERTVLCILERWYSSSKDKGNQSATLRAILQVFVLYFAASDFDSRTTRAALTPAALSAQIHDIWQQGEQSVAWRNVYTNTDFSDSEYHWAVTRAELSALTLGNGIDLIEKVSENKIRVKARLGNGIKRKKRKTRDSDSGVLGNVVDGNDISEDNEIAVSKRRRKCASGNSSTPRRPQQRKYHGLLTPPESPHSTVPGPMHSCIDLTPSSRLQGMNLQQFALGHSSTSDPLEIRTSQNSPCAARNSRRFIKKRPWKYERPRPKTCGLAFRIWDDYSHGTNTEEGFRAGAFPVTTLDPIPPPPDHNSSTFRDIAINHITPLEKPSCLISITTSPLRPLHRCLRSTSNGKVAMIDLGYLKTHQPWTFPRLYYASAVIRKFKIPGVSPRTGQIFNYRGAREVLVWGYIEPEAILAVFSKPDLLEYLRTHSRLREVLQMDAFQKATTSYEYRKELENSVVEMDEDTGYGLGHFFGCVLKIPISLVNTTALVFAESFQFEGNQSSEKTFLRGVEAGYHAYLLQLLPIKNMPGVAVIIERPNKRQKEAVANLDDFLKCRERIENVLGLNRY
ncbi:MAG: hypothetical protein Q9187_004882 [Circinaria calcarea]